MTDATKTFTAHSAGAEETAPDRTAIVVGASLAGLMSALTLARAGLTVTMLERSADTGRTGAVLYGEPGLVERLSGEAAPSRRGGSATTIGAGPQSWKTIHDGLRAGVDGDPRITVHDAVTVETVAQDADEAWVTTTDGRHYRADVVIGADGHRSTVRRALDPDRPDADYAGYVIWIGISEESAMTHNGKWPSSMLYTNTRRGPLLGSPLPAEDGSQTPGTRRLSWAWYDAGSNALLRSTGSVVGNIVRHSLLAHQVPDRLLAGITSEAGCEVPSPWRDAIIDSASRHAVIGTPIAEYVPDRLVNGRLALVGDAAHVPSPMTGTGFSESRQDAEALGQALGHFTAQSEMVRALERYQRSRLSDARNLVQSGQQFSRSFANGRY